MGVACSQAAVYGIEAAARRARVGVGGWPSDRSAVGALPLRSQGQRAGRRNRQGGQLPGPDHRNCGRQDRAPGGSQTGAHPYHPGLAGRVVPPAYGRAPPPARRRRRQAGRGRRPPVESRPLDLLYPVATQGRAGALPAVQAVRQPAVQRGPLPGMPGGSRHPEARGPALPGPHEHPVQAAGMPLPRNGGRAERRRRGGPGGRIQRLLVPSTFM